MEDISIGILSYFAIYLFVYWHQLYYKINVSTPSVLRFLCVIRHESPRYTHAFTEKAQHLQRWIPLWMLTRGRLVPRQPRAIKRTTRTELHGESIVRVALLIIKGKTIYIISCDDLLLFTAWNDGNGVTKCTFQRRRCCAFDSPGLPNDSAGYPGLVDIVRGTTPSVLRFLCVIRHESPRYTHAFTEKAQHLQRWIPLRSFTRGRLVPRQPRAIKSTTRTELRDEIIVVTMLLIMKRKMICGILSCKIRQIIWSFDAFCRPICFKSFYL